MSICTNTSPARSATFPPTPKSSRGLRERGLLTADGAVNAVVVQGEMEAFFSSLPVLRDDLKKTFADFALERAEMEARDYPPQMRDLVVSWSVSRFIGGMTALLVLDALYADGAFRPLTEAERAAFGLLVFSDKLPGPEGARGLIRQRISPARERHSDLAVPFCSFYGFYRQYASCIL